MRAQDALRHDKVPFINSCNCQKYEDSAGFDNIEKNVSQLSKAWWLVWLVGNKKNADFRADFKTVEMLHKMRGVND
jgi:hypothetical protein